MKRADPHETTAGTYALAAIGVLTGVVRVYCIEPFILRRPEFQPKIPHPVTPAMPATVEVLADYRPVPVAPEALDIGAMVLQHEKLAA